jgi:hypothetical protein
MRIRKLTEKEVEFEFIRLDEFESPDGNFAYGDDEEDEKAVQRVFDQLNAGNEYAWFCAEVKAKWNGFEASDCLGCCSYKSKEDFMNCSYEDMKSQALEFLNLKLFNTVVRLSPLEIK